MSQPPGPDETSSAARDHAQVMEMLGSAETQARLEEARAQRERVLAEREVARGTKEPDEKRVPQVLSNLLDAKGAASAQQDAHVADVLGWSGMQRRLEELRVQREEAQGSREVDQETEQGDEVPSAGSDRPAALSGVVASDLPAGGSPRPVLRALRRPPGFTTAQAPDSVLAVAPPRRRPWPVSLVLGLCLGLALGAGLVRLVEVAAPPAPAASEAAPGLQPAAGPAASRLSAPLVEPVAPSGLALAPSTDDPRAGRALADHPVPRSGRRTLGQPQPADDVEIRAASASVPTATEGVDPPPPSEPDALGVTHVVATMAPVVPRSPTLQVMAPTSARDFLPSFDQEVPATPPGTGDTVEVAAVPTFEWSPQVDLRLPSDLPQATLRQVQSALQATGVDLASVGTARFSVAESEVRYFHEADGPDAARVAAAMGAEARDFSAFRPAPQLGTLEVWLAEDG